MNAVLLDTTTASLLHPKRNHSRLRALYGPHLRGRVLALSFQSGAELWAWAEENSWGAKQRTCLDASLRRFLVIPCDYRLAQLWAQLRAQTRRLGRRLEAEDAWITATVIHRDLELVTHDRDFDGPLGTKKLEDLPGAHVGQRDESVGQAPPHEDRAAVG
ncbi:MAG: PIN domain-containing protein, partial [Proteobacteria bacterium]|nr:PIN domain-containing protein [Pseudomonadota bacterium]